MAMEELLERIQRDMEREVASIREDGERNAAQIEEAARAKESAAVKREMERCRSQFAFESKRKLSALKCDQNRQALDERETMLQAVLLKLEEQIAALPAAEEKSMLQKILKKSLKDIPHGTIRLNTRTKEIIAAEIKTLKVETDDSLAGGFLLISESGEKVLDCTYPALVDLFWEKHRIDVARVLVGEELASGKLIS